MKTYHSYGAIGKRLKTWGHTVEDLSEFIRNQDVDGDNRCLLAYIAELLEQIKNQPSPRQSKAKTTTAGEMNTCARGHVEICYKGDRCPACDALETCRDMHGDLRNMRDDLAAAMDRISQLEDNQ